MAEFDDGYESYYANRLWQLLPGVYRAQDSEASGVEGPLQEMVNRIGAQIAIVRALNEGKEATPVTQRRKRAIS